MSDQTFGETRTRTDLPDWRRMRALGALVILGRLGACLNLSIAWLTVAAITAPATAGMVQSGTASRKGSGGMSRIASGRLRAALVLFARSPALPPLMGLVSVTRAIGAVLLAMGLTRPGIRWRMVDGPVRRRVVPAGLVSALPVLMILAAMAEGTSGVAGPVPGVGLASADGAAIASAFRNRCFMA